MRYHYAMEYSKTGEPLVAYSNPVGRLLVHKRTRDRLPVENVLVEYEGSFPRKLLPKSEELWGREVTLLLPGFSYSEAQAVVQRWYSAVWGGRLGMTHKGVPLDRTLPELEQMLDSVVADSNWVLQGAYEQNVPHAVQWKRIEGDCYELQAFTSGMSSQMNKEVLVARAKLTGRVLRFMYPDRFGVLRTRRVAVRKFSANELYDRTVGALENKLYRKPKEYGPYFAATVREFDSFERTFVKRHRRFTFAKAQDMVLETAPVKSLQPEWLVRVNFAKHSCSVKLDTVC